MSSNDTDLITFNLLKEAVESQGCRIAEIDFENLLLKVDGDDEVVGDCAKAVAKILG